MKIKKILFVITTMFLMVQGASAWNGSGSSGDPYLIASTADWNTLASNVANGNTYSNTYFKLTADITVTTMVTATFSGTFDGGGHTLTFNYTATGNNAAPFAYITGATIKNLRVAGTINSGYKFAAGIVAISNGGSIENCQSSVTIDSSTSGDGTHGGLVADSYTGTLDISNCLFDGKLLGTTTTSCGGIVGWHNSNSTLYISNSLFAPAEMTIQTTGGAIFARNGVSKLTNCYYISDWAAATMQGTNAGSMTKPELVAALNNGDKHWCIHRSSVIPIMVNLVINNASEWNSFASNVSDYNDKYVKLNADISVTTIATGSFTGIFDGNGHTMTVNISPASGNEAAFRYLNNGTIMNLNVTGTVTAGSYYASGLVARTSGGDCLIDNCIVNTNVAGSGYAGGIVAHGDNAKKLTISNCVYGGTLTQSGGYIGGIFGWYNKDKTLDLVMTNCLFKGDYTGNGQFHPIGLKRANECSFKSISCTNCYYTKNPANIDDARRTFTDGTKVCELSLGDNIIATGSSCTFAGKTYHLGTVSLSYTPSKPTLFYMIDGNEISGNSFTISKDNQAFDAGAVTITAGDTSITYHYGGTNNTILYIDVNNGNSNMVTHPWTSEANYSSITSVVIGNGVTSICGNAFKQCPNLTSASIASTVTSIDNQAFSECGKLETVTFTDADNSHLTIIRPNAFANCVKLSSITIPEGVGEIGDFAFVCSSALVSATLPSTLSTMGVHVFRDCTSLASVFCLASTPPTGGSNMFNNNASGRKIYVPSESIGAYQAAEYWSSYASDIIGIQSLTLNENTDNSTFISANNGLVYDITLGRTLQAGGWNTFCVPFDISSSQITSKFGSGTEVRELGSSDFDEGTKALTLNFTEASTIKAGKPYLVYLGSGSNVVNPTFEDVTIVSGTTTKTTGYANFVPVMNPTSLTGGDKSILFVTGGDKLTYPSSTGNINGFRAYFQLHDLPTEAHSFAMSFDDETTAVRGIENGETTFGAYGESQLRVENSYYDLQGRRVVQPTKGLYIVNGKKLIIK